LPAEVAELAALAEFPEVGERAYVIESGGAGELSARALEVDEVTRRGFAFRRPSGPRSPQVGPVFKRSLDPKKGVGPGATTLAATLTHFEAMATSASPAAGVYRRALEVAGGGDGSARVDRVLRALTAIPEKKTVFVSLGEPAGADPAYASHLLGVIREDLYGIDDSAPEGVCPSCGRTARLGWSALKGAKVNFLNADNHGVFPGFDLDRAGDRFALCAACADAIASTYIRLKTKLRVMVAGSPALILPYLVAPGSGSESSREAWAFLDQAREGKGTSVLERDLLDALAEESALAAFHILWAATGDSLDDVTGFITDVPVTRLGTLSAENTRANGWTGGVLPARRVRPFDLRLSLVGEILEHPGGKRVERRNRARLAALRRGVARAVYLREPLAAAPLFAELRDIMADHLVDPTVDESFVAHRLTHEPAPSKKGEVYLNAASWIRHAALLLHYLRHLGVLPPMSTAERFQPRSERLRPLLAESSGVDTDEKAFAFLVGILFGRLLKIQGAEGFNVRSNALTWLRRATLSGGDLPGLYVRIREKLIAYGAEASPVLREILRDVGALGARVGTGSALDADQTMFFLFLGQALSGDVFVKEEPPKEETPKEPR
jgi:CRISPR-associated protein Csh1